MDSWKCSTENRNNDNFFLLKRANKSTIKSTELIPIRSPSNTFIWTADQISGPRLYRVLQRLSAHLFFVFYWDWCCGSLSLPSYFHFQRISSYKTSCCVTVLTSNPQSDGGYSPMSVEETLSSSPQELADITVPLSWYEHEFKWALMSLRQLDVEMGNCSIVTAL